MSFYCLQALWGGLVVEKVSPSQNREGAIIHPTARSGCALRLQVFGTRLRDVYIIYAEGFVLTILSHHAQ